jgi:hypothetical protein
MTDALYIQSDGSWVGVSEGESVRCGHLIFKNGTVPDSVAGFHMVPLWVAEVSGWGMVAKETAAGEIGAVWVLG